MIFPSNTRASNTLHVLKMELLMEFHGVTKNGMVMESGHGESATCVLVPGDTAGRPWKTYVPTAQVHNYKTDCYIVTF